MPARKRQTGVWHRLKGLITGGATELEAERHTLFETAKQALQREVEAGKITAAELERQLLLLRNGHVDPDPHQDHA